MTILWFLERGVSLAKKTHSWYLPRIQKLQLAPQATTP